MRPYSERVNTAQSDLDYIESEYDLTIDLTSEADNVRVGNRTLTLTPRELFFYTLFAEARLREPAEGSIVVDQLSRDDFDRIFRKITRAHCDEVGIEECSSHESLSFLEEMIEQLHSSRAKDQTDFREKLLQTNSRINRKFKDAGLPERYMITLRDARGTSCYGLSVAPLRIKFV